MPDGGHFPYPPSILNGPDGAGFSAARSYATQPDGAGMPVGEVREGLRYGPLWTSRTNPAGINASRRLRVGRGVAIAHSGAANASVIGRTVNGVTWESVDVGISLDWSNAATDGKGNWCMLAGLRVATDVYVVSNDDGKTWSQRTMPVPATWNVLEYGNGTLLAIEGGLTSSTVAYASENMGESWRLATMDRASNWHGAAFSPEVGYWVATDSLSDFVSISYDNGASWLPQANINAATTAERMVWIKPNPAFPGVFIIPAGTGGGANFRYSTDGKTWADTLASNGRSSTYSNVISGNGTALAISGFGGEVTTSLNGTTDWNDAINTAFVQKGNNHMPNAGSTIWHGDYLGNGIFVAVQNGTATAASGIG